MGFSCAVDMMESMMRLPPAYPTLAAASGPSAPRTPGEYKALRRPA
jgi:hypothetical protein